MPRNIVLVCLDSVRNDVFEEFAVRTQERADLTVENCRAASSWSAPSHASMITGDLPHRHGVTTHARSFESVPREETVFADLEGYRTVGISANTYAGPAYDFDRYFDEFYPLRRGIRFPEALDPYTGDFDTSFGDFLSYFRDCLCDDRPAKSVTNGLFALFDSLSSSRVSSWLLDRGARPGLRLAKKTLREEPKPSFVFLNLMEGHLPFRPARYLDGDMYDVPRGWDSNERGTWELIGNDYDETYWSRRNQLYRATVDYLDRCIARFVRDIDTDTTVIVTADHGENLGTEVDEGLANHKSSLSEGLLHVPLSVIHPPAVSEQTGRYLSQLSLPGLITGIRDGHIPDLHSDRAVAELGGMSAGDEPPTDREYYDRAMRCAYDTDEKTVWDSLGNCTRYRLDSNRANWQEKQTDIDGPPAWADEQFATDITTFKETAVATAEQVSIDDSTAQRLEELGYL